MSERLETLKKARERMIEDRVGTRMRRCWPLLLIRIRPSKHAANSPRLRR
jgi:hypothetical protein